MHMQRSPHHGNTQELRLAPPVTAPRMHCTCRGPISHTRTTFNQYYSSTTIQLPQYTASTEILHAMATLIKNQDSVMLSCLNKSEAKIYIQSFSCVGCIRESQCLTYCMLYIVVLTDVCPFQYTDRTPPMDKHVGVMANKFGISAAPITPQLFGNAGREHMEKYGQCSTVSLLNHTTNQKPFCSQE